jgi:hypothetical protein
MGYDSTTLNNNLIEFKVNALWNSLTI